MCAAADAVWHPDPPAESRPSRAALHPARVARLEPGRAIGARGHGTRRRLRRQDAGGLAADAL